MNLAFFAVLRGHFITDTRHLTIQVFVGLFFIIQAAHQSATHARDLGRIE